MVKYRLYSDIEPCKLLVAFSANTMPILSIVYYLFCIDQMLKKLNKNNYQQAKYRLNADRYEQLPVDCGREVAFAGRSNAGKSSVINSITMQNSLARTSKTPGRTRHLVCFDLDEDRRLIDLPGYGYAKVNLAVKSHWGKTLDQYFQQRESLVGLVLIMDIRHPLKEYDRQMIDWCQSQSLAVHVMLNKADKLSRGAASKQLQMVKQQLPEGSSVQLFSALKKNGVVEARSKLDEWLLFSGG